MPRHRFLVAAESRLRSILEHGGFDLAQLAEEFTKTRQTDVTSTRQVVPPLREQTLVDAHHRIEAARADIKRWQMRQKIVPDKVADKHKVIHEPFQVVVQARLPHRLVQALHLEMQVVPQHREV